MASKDLALVSKQMPNLRFWKCFLHNYIYFVLGPGTPAPSVPNTGEQIDLVFKYSYFSCSWKINVNTTGTNYGQQRFQFGK